MRGDWRHQLGRLIKFVDGAIADFIITQHHHFYSDGLCRLSTLISSAQIMEELRVFSFDSSQKRYVNPTPLEGLFAVAHPGIVLSSESAKGIVRLFFPPLSSRADRSARQGDRLSGSSRWLEKDTGNSIDSYRLASMIDPSNFGARLNSAAVRLRLADDDSQAFQSVYSHGLSLGR